MRAGLSRAVRRLSDREGGGGGLLGRALNPGHLTSSVTAPGGSAFAFVEAIGTGGNISTSGSTQAAGGGAGNDAIVSVAPGDVFVSTVPTPQGSGKATTIQRGGATLLSAASAEGANEKNGAAGKYPGGTATTNVGGRGGGRLGGQGAGVASANSPGLGAGIGGSASRLGGAGGTCITFFATYDEALAFAKAVYGGTWAP